MADTGDHATDPELSSPGGSRRSLSRLVRVLLVLAVLAALALAIAWTQRERIADNVVARELRSRGIPATYEVERIGGRRQVLRNVVVGDPARPDLTVERAEVRIEYRVGFPTIGRVTLVRPRLYGTYRRGTLSFGTLDPLIFTGRKRAFELPKLDLRLIDGRALLETDYGRLGFKAAGEGKLNNGFAGMIAVAGPELAGFGCSASAASFYGTIRIRAERPRLAGPLRLGRLACPQRGLALEQAALRVDATLDQDVRGADGTARLASGAFAWGGVGAASLAATTRFSYRDDALTVRFDGDAGGVATPAASFGRLASAGTLWTRDGFARIEYQSSLSGTGAALGPALDRSLAGLQASAGETMLAPLLAQLRRAAARETRGSRLAAELDFRQEAGRFTLYVSQARLRGGSGEQLLALSRVSLRSGERGGAPRFAGNFVTGGAGLPRIVGETERADEGRTVLRLTMAEYRAGAAALALPQLVLVQAGDGSLGFVGEARASGPLPGGFARNLAVPLDGSLGANGALALFRRCTTLRFDQLALASLTLERRSLTLCPQRGEAIVRTGPGGLRIAAGAPSLDLAGRFGQTPLRLVSGPIGFAYPGVVSARDVAITLGRAGAPNRFRLARLEGRIGAMVSSGRFAGAEARLFATPLDITEASGAWRYARGRVSVTDAALRVTDRAAPARFAPLKANGATLTLVGNTLEANAALRHAATDRPVTRAVLRHDLASGRGNADLFVEQLRFDEGLQPSDISRLALGTVANVRGTIDGTGRIEWSPRGVTSTGTLSTESLDLAAAFGPVRGISGTVRFTDLLGMVTAPDQEIRVASLNPGIEVTEGVVRFELLAGGIFRLKNASWPFLGGTLSLAPVDLNLGVSEARRYTLIIDGLDAARFIERMELANISATGVFDGRLPLVFAPGSGTEQLGAAVGALVGIGTAQGAAAAASTPGSGRIEGGVLTSRPPGGNVSYVGDLTYRDLSTMANFAFQTLRSLDYRAMTIHLDGALEGEIVTRVQFDGVRQGAGAKRNILTRAVADIPIQMIINIRAPFYQLITSMKALYDPAFVKDPRSLGLLDEKGRPIAQPQRPPPANPAPAPAPPASPPPLPPGRQPSGPPAIQPPASETAP